MTTYTVSKGDTLAKISGRFGTEVAALLAANPGIANPNVIKAGQQLTIPDGVVAGTDGSLSMEPDALLGFAALWPCIESSAARCGTDARVLAGIVCQESGFKNWRVHQDGTGHGLIGLDDNGLLPDFENWSGLSCGRGQAAAVIPPERQVEYLAIQIAKMAAAHGGDVLAAARQWHRGGRLMDDARGMNYQELIEGHIRKLFAEAMSVRAPGAVSSPPVTFVGGNAANCYPDRHGYVPEVVVLHIAEGTLAGVDSWFNNPNAQAGAHFCVGKDGSIHQYFKLDQAPYANGAVEAGCTARFVADNLDLNQRFNPNWASISVEHEGRSGDSVPPAQFEASVHLTAWLFDSLILPAAETTGAVVDRAHILRHGDISPSSRPHCPGWSEAFHGRYIARVCDLLAQTPAPTAQAASGQTALVSPSAPVTGQGGGQPTPVPAPDSATVVAPTRPVYRDRYVAELRGIVASARDDAGRAQVRKASAMATIEAASVTMPAALRDLLMATVQGANEDAVRAALRADEATVKLDAES